MGWGPKDTVVLDPPYADTTPLSYTDATVDYHELVDLLLRAKFRWVLCGYIHPALHRLGNPCWAKDVRFLCPRGEEARRTECLWTNRPNDMAVKKYSLPLVLRGRLRTQNHASNLSFSALDAKIDEGLGIVARDWASLIPFLLEMNRRLSAPGKRTDLRKGAPIGLTWTQWVDSKRSRLGRSLRTIQNMLRGKTEASRDRQMLLAQPHAGLRSEPEWSIPDTPIEIATEMSRLVLEMRDTSRNEMQRKQKLELLAEHFLRITGQDREGIDDITHSDRRFAAGVN